MSESYWALCGSVGLWVKDFWPQALLNVYRTRSISNHGAIL